MPRPYRRHLKSSRDLDTTYEAVRAGFIALALERNRRASPHVADARALKSIASTAGAASELPKLSAIRAALLTASGVSAKAGNHLTESDKDEAIAGLVADFLEPAGASFVDELVYRFLLTRGDALGGSMRNIGGFMAQCKLTRSLIAHLKVRGTRFRWLPANTRDWIDQPDDDTDIEHNLRGLAWANGRRPRHLVYNVFVPFCGNNVDLSLMRGAAEGLAKTGKADPACYLGLGELKGGIDPSGADEHWKTARTAIHRIRDKFAERDCTPRIFFVGAAIEKKMANEIWRMLESGDLDNAANLTKDDQMSSLARWLFSL